MWLLSGRIRPVKQDLFLFGGTFLSTENYTESVIRMDLSGISLGDDTTGIVRDLEVDTLHSYPSLCTTIALLDIPFSYRNGRLTYGFNSVDLFSAQAQCPVL